MVKLLKKLAIRPEDILAVLMIIIMGFVIVMNIIMVILMDIYMRFITVECMIILSKDIDID